MSDQDPTSELLARRQALVEAVNSQEMEAIKGFIDPSYIARSRGGIGLTYRYHDILDLARLTFRWTGNFRETVDVEKVDLHGDEAELTTTRHDSYTLFGFLKKRGDTRQIETWKKIDGEWKATGEEVLEIHEHVAPGVG